MWSFFLNALIRVAGSLSWPRAQRLGAVLGLVWFHVVRVRRRTVLANLALALPDRRAQHRDIARSAYRHFGISFLEFLKMRSLDAAALRERVRTRGMEHYEAALGRGRGVIAVTAHFGNFDLLACSQPAFGVPLAIVSRELHQSGVSRLWMAMRREKGLEIFPDRGAARQVVGWLRAGKVLGLTVDQRTAESQGGIRSDFLGQQAWTTTAPAVLAARTGAAVLPVRIARLETGEHELVVEPEIACDVVDKDQLIKIVTDRINAVVGQWVAERPDQWMWLHRRFADPGKTEA